MADPVAGGKITIAQWDRLDARLDAIETSGNAGAKSESTANGTVSSTTYTSTFSAGGTCSVTVTLAAGQNCLVGVHCEGNSGTANCGLRISFAVSGQATEAATDNRGGVQKITALTQTTSFGRVTLYTAPSAGSYTFTLQGKVDTGSGSFNQRVIFAQPQPYPS